MIPYSDRACLNRFSAKMKKLKIVFIVDIYYIVSIVSIELFI